MSDDEQDEMKSLLALYENKADHIIHSMNVYISILQATLDEMRDILKKELKS